MTNLEFEHTSPKPGETLDEMIERMMAQIDVHMQALEEQLNALDAQLAVDGLSPERRQRVERKLERARKRGETAARRLRKKLGNRWRRTRRQPVPHEGERLAEMDVAAGGSVSDEERMMVLQMLQEDKITLEQAETLLAALDGE